MNAQSKTIEPSRRDLVVGASLVGGALLVGCSPADLLAAGAKTEVGAFGPFIKIAADGAVTVISKHIEFGQGNHAGLAAIVAEELDADWTRVVVEQAPANAKLYANLGMGAQGTGGSTAIANSWDQLRKAGAGARGPPRAWTAPRCAAGPAMHSRLLRSSTAALVGFSRRGYPVGVPGGARGAQSAAKAPRVSTAAWGERRAGRFCSTAALRGAVVLEVYGGVSSSPI